MAEAYGKLTGRPGICMVTRGPGATQAAVGVHTAFQDSTPLILLVGQVASSQEEREAFQEVDYRRMFGPLAKWVAQIDSVDRIPELVARAYTIACAGRPGPVVLALPEDMLVGGDRSAGRTAVPRRAAEPGGRRRRVAADAARRRERPFAIVGGAGWTRSASEDMRVFLEANDAARRRGVPAAGRARQRLAVLRRRRRHRDQPGARRRASAKPTCCSSSAPRLGEMTTSGYTLLDVPQPRQTLVHVHPGAEELGRVYQAELPILSGMAQFAAAVRDLRVEPRWREWRGGGAGRATRRGSSTRRCPARVDLGDCIAHLRERVPDAIVTNGAGNHTVWVHRFWRFHSFPSQLAPTSGAMGYGVPAAVAAKAVAPERTVVCFSGDGDFLMSGAGARDGRAVRPADRRDRRRQRHVRDDPHAPGAPFPGRVVGTDLVNPDFAALRARVRRARRDRRAHGRVRGRVRARARRRADRRCCTCASIRRRSTRGRR